jgi:hypothetical protein
METLASDPNMPQPGELVADRYRIEAPLGEGGFAVVYRAADARTGAPVAVKVLDPLMSRRQSNIQRFQREIELVARLRHPNTIRVTDCGATSSGCLFLVMELLDGRALDSVLEKEGKLSPDRVRRIVMQLLKSLAEAHREGIIHRDLKPANVFLAQVAGERDYVKVLDFGIAKAVGDDDAKLTKSGEIPCSPHYVAPERVALNSATAASDLYSVGVMMIELLEGAPPYRQDSLMALVLEHADMSRPVPMSDETAEGPLGGVLARATAKRVEDRYATAEEMLEALEGGAAHAALHAPSARTATQPTPVELAGRGATIGAAEADTATLVRESGLARPVAVGLVLVAALGVALFVLVRVLVEGERAPASDQSVSTEAAAAGHAVPSPPSIDEPAAVPPAVPVADPSPGADERAAAAALQGEGVRLAAAAGTLGAEVQGRARAACDRISAANLAREARSSSAGARDAGAGRARGGGRGGGGDREVASDRPAPVAEPAPPAVVEVPEPAEPTPAPVDGAGGSTYTPLGLRPE